jgi:hypothetical protein
MGDYVLPSWQAASIPTEEDDDEVTLRQKKQGIDRPWPFDPEPTQQ